jgi:hypothetical protein
MRWQGPITDIAAPPRSMNSRFDHLIGAQQAVCSNVRTLLAFFDLDLLLLLRHLCRLWQVDAQNALIKFRLDLGRVRIERQGYCPAERAVAALHHMSILVLVLFVALGPFLAADGQHPIGECHIEILLVDAWQLCRHVNRVLALGDVDLWR